MIDSFINVRDRADGISGRGRARARTPALASRRAPVSTTDVNGEGTASRWKVFVCLLRSPTYSLFLNGLLFLAGPRSNQLSVRRSEANGNRGTRGTICADETRGSRTGPARVRVPLAIGDDQKLCQEQCAAAAPNRDGVHLRGVHLHRYQHRHEPLRM